MYRGKLHCISPLAVASAANKQSAERTEAKRPL